MTENEWFIRHAQKEDLPRLATLLARAFARDPAYRWFFPAASSRFTRSRRLFSLHLRRAAAQGAVWMSAGAEGVAVGLPPLASRPSSLEEEIAYNMAVSRLLGRYIYRGVLWWWLLERHHPPYPHYTLFLLGVEPQYQRRGVGSALLRQVVRHAEDAGLPIYVDTSNVANLPFYHHAGFQVVRAVRLPGGPEVFQMIREPK